MKYSSLLAALCALSLLALAVGCSKDSNPVAPQPIPPGMLYVQVVSPSSIPVAGAIVAVNPSGRRDTTDVLGTVLLEELTPGTYTVLASRSLVGGGRQVVTVKSGEVTATTVKLVSGVYMEPSVNIISPWDGYEYSYVDTAAFLASVTDLEDPAAALQLAWTSNVDGPLPVTPAGRDGSVSLRTDALTLGTHWISLRATDSQGNVGRDSVRVVIRSFSPMVYLERPAYPAQFTPGLPIALEATVSDRETPKANLDIQWFGSIDGPLGTGTSETGLSVTLSRADLSFGDQWIVLQVRDTDGNLARDSVMIHNVLPGPISLAPPVLSSGRVSLSWTKAIPAGFDHYEVYRSATPGITRTGSAYRIFSTAAETTWVDSLPPMANQAYYRVFSVNSSNFVRSSEERVVDSPGGLVLTSVTTDDAVIHPTHSWIYLNERSTGKITVVDYRANTIVRTLTLGASSGYVDLVDNGYGLELYIPRSDGWVQVRDAEDLHLITSINTGLPNGSVIGDGAGHVYVSVTPSPWWETPLRSYRRSDGSFISGSGDFDYCRLRLLQSRHDIIEITMSVSPVDMDYYRIGGDGTILSHTDDIQHGGTPLDPALYRVSPAQNYLVTSNSGSLYRADSTMAYLGSLPRGSLTFGDFAFSADGSTVYAGCSNERLVKIHSYPSLSETGYMQTRGYPYFMWKVGNELICLSRTTIQSYYYGSFDLGIEIVPLSATVPGGYAQLRAKREPGPVAKSARALRAAPPGH